MKSLHLRIVTGAAFLTASSFSFNSRAVANVTYWIAPGGGVFGDPGNWSDGVPGPQSSAVFDLPGTIDVLLNRNAVANQLIVDAGDVTFFATGSELFLNSAVVWTPSLIVAGESGATTSLSIAGGEVTGGFAIVGEQGGAYGSLALSGGAQVDLAGQIWIGMGGSGSLLLEEESSMMSIAATIGASAGALGDVHLKGGSEWVIAMHARTSQFLGSESHIIVEGAYTMWEVLGNMDVAVRDRGTLTISDGAEVIVHGSAFVGALTGVVAESVAERGEINVFGRGTRLHIAGDLWLGQSTNVPAGAQWTGKLGVGGGGRVRVDGLLAQRIAVVEVGLGASDDYIDQAAISAAAGSHPAGAVIEVQLADEFSPTIGDIFRIITLPTASLMLPDLPWPLLWDVVETGEEVELYVTFIVDADITGDGSVGVPDLLILLANWGPCPDPTPGQCTGDLNFDGAVGVTDLLLLLANWG